jgi:CheY-like chemotaxis protein/HAMP domain-containing protein
MNFFNRLSIRAKLVVLCIIPLLGLAYALQIDIRRELTNKRTAAQVLEGTSQIAEISKVIHEFQVERALSLTLLVAPNSSLRQEIITQREQTDKVIASLGKLLRTQGQSIAQYGLIDSLPAIRAKVNDLASRDEIDPFYERIKVVLLNEVSTILRNSQNPTLKNHLEEHLYVLYTKDFLAQIRSELAIAMRSGVFTGTTYGDFASGKGKHEVKLARFRNIASPELKAFFDQKYRGPSVDKTYQIIQAVFSDPQLIHVPFTYDEWWDASTASINILKEVEDFSTELITREATEQLSLANGIVLRNIAIALIIMLAIIAMVMFTLRSIIEAIGNIRAAADRMAQGEVGELVTITTNDEIGALARSFNDMIGATRNFSEIANTIGKGDYSPIVAIRGSSDTLGIALRNMKDSLQTLSRENEMRNWLLTGNSELNDSLRGEKDVRALAQDVIIQLVNYMQGLIGAIYLAENGSLELTGMYAFDYREGSPKRFNPGEGLVGQAAIEKKSIVFNNIPENYIRINSGLGNAVPRSIIVFPFLMDGEVKGVVEIGSASEFSALHMQFLDMVGENIAIAFNAAQSRQKLKELLEETQRQAEELETQQEELKQSNEELLEKTNLLERSEAELKAQQEELQQTNEELEEKANLLEEQKEKLEFAKVEIENKARDLEITSKYKSEFLANMSHELRTPLNSILILSQLLAENKSGALAEKEVEFCRNIYNAGTDLLTLINEILDLSKVESGRMELDIAEMPISAIVPAMDSMFRELATTRGIEFRIHVHDKLKDKNMTTDEQRLEQILRNLVSNAFKFTDAKGTVILNVHPAQSDTTFTNPSLYDAAAIVAFSVTDTGIGIPAHKLAVIFEAFQQADGSTKRKYGGTGLGLSISRELSQVLGGEIQVESQEGKGSTFTLFLPVTFRHQSASGGRRVDIREKNPVASAVNMPATLPEGYENNPAANDDVSDDRNNLSENDKVILILEDDPDFSSVLLHFVRGRGYKGIIAGSGSVGLSLARHYRPDAILLDMKLPVMEGGEVLKHLKNDPELRHIPVQIISGFDHRKESMELGAFDYLSKPVSAEGLQSAFDKIEEFMKKKLKKLLIIEDDARQSKAIRELIGNGDVKSSAAFSGQEALDMMAKTNFDCVILDLGLPDMTGFELLEKFRANEKLNKVPVIIYTGRDLSKAEHDRLVRFANTVVMKTVDSHERLLDETMLFLHRVEANLPKDKQNIIRKLHRTDEVLRNRKVLVVDDDIRNIYSLTNVLEEQGVNCLTAENGKVALKVLSDNPDTELVLMDVMMPEMDGFEATKAIRSIDDFRKLPVIALTAKAMKGDREKCLSVGMSDYIAKPLNVDKLLSLMRIWLYR